MQYKRRVHCRRKDQTQRKKITSHSFPHSCNVGCNINVGYIVVGKTQAIPFLIHFFLQIKNSEFSMTDNRVCNQSNTTGAMRGAGTVYPLGVPKFIPGF